MDYTYGLSSHGWFVAMQGVGNDVAILHNGPDGGRFLPIDYNVSTLYSIFLDSISRNL